MASIKLQLDNNEVYTIIVEPRHHNYRFVVPIDPEIMPKYADIIDTDGLPIEIEDSLDMEFVEQLLAFGLDIMLVAAANYHVKERLIRRVNLETNQI